MTLLAGEVEGSYICIRGGILCKYAHVFCTVYAAKSAQIAETLGDKFSYAGGGVGLYSIQ